MHTFTSFAFGEVSVSSHPIGERQGSKGYATGQRSMAIVFKGGDIVGMCMKSTDAKFQLSMH